MPTLSGLKIYVPACDADTGGMGQASFSTTAGWNVHLTA